MPPTDWPSPPLLSHLLFENPWPLVLVLATVAIGMFLIGGRQGRWGVQKAAAVPLLAAIILPVLAHFIVTDIEQLRANTRRLVEAVSFPLDVEEIRELTTEDARLLHWNREQLINVARNASQIYEITGYTITNLMARRDSDLYGKTYVAVFVEGNRRGGLYGRPIRSRWILNWRRGEDGAWRLSAVDQVEVGGRPAENILRQMIH